MARPIRIEYAGAVYHVTARGNERKAVFRDDDDRRRFSETLAECVERFGLVVHAYCLMPNHYHLIAETPRGNLSGSLGWLQTTYSIRFNRRHGRVGHLFQGRFKALLVEADGYARELVRYVHLNPVRPRDKKAAVPADRQTQLDRYRWSSHRAYAGLEQAPEWLSLDWLSYWGRKRSDARRGYRRSMAGAFGQVARSPLAEARGGLALGGEHFWEKVAAMLEKREGQEEVRWRRRAGQDKVNHQVREMAEREADRRIGIWLRVRLAGERPADLARELGYADGSGVLRVVQRLDVAAEQDRSLRRRLDSARESMGMSRVKS
jgi:putative transposase